MQHRLADNVTQMSAFRRKSRNARCLRAPGAAAVAPPNPSPVPRCLCIPMQGQQNPIAVVAATPLQWKKGTTPHRPRAWLWCRASRQWLWRGAAGPCLPAPLPSSGAAPPGTARPPMSAPARREGGLGPGLWGPSAGSGMPPARAAVLQMCQMCPAAPSARGIQTPSSHRSQPRHHLAWWAAAVGEGAGARRVWNA